MAVQARSNNANIPFIRGGNAYDLDDQTIQEDIARSANMLFGTIMAKVAATGEWTPFIDETATDGTAIPQGIYIGEDIAAADFLSAITDVKILIGGRCLVDADQIVLENSKTLGTVITVGTTDLRTVRDHLEDVGIFLTEDVIDIDEYENT